MVVYHSAYTVICCRRLLCECLTASEVSQFRPFQLFLHCRRQKTQWPFTVGRIACLVSLEPNQTDAW